MTDNREVLIAVQAKMIDRLDKLVELYSVSDETTRLCADIKTIGDAIAACGPFVAHVAGFKPSANGKH